MARAIPPGSGTGTTNTQPLTQPTKVGHALSPGGHGKKSRFTSLSVVIVNFCQWSNTSRLVRQLRHSEVFRTGMAEIVIVDNHSPPHRLAQVLARHRDVQVLESAQNEGFARGVNRGVAESSGDWILLLNPDVSVPEGMLDQVLELAESDESRRGVIGFQLLNPDGSRQASCGPYPTLLGSLMGLFRPRAVRKCRNLSSESPMVVEWATGGCLLIRRECFEELAGLDETFFLYYEDVDFCQRAAHHGWSVWYEPRVHVTHHWPLHRRKVPAPLRLITRHALLKYAEKHWPRWQTWALAKLILLEAQYRKLVSLARGDAVSAQSYRELADLVLHRNDPACVSVLIQKAASRLRAIVSVDPPK